MTNLPEASVLMKEPISKLFTKVQGILTTNAQTTEKDISREIREPLNELSHEEYIIFKEV